MGYSVGMKGGEPRVMVAPRRWKRIEEIGNEIALHNTAKVHDFFHRFLGRVSPFSFPGIVRQKEKLLEDVNERRKTAGLTSIGTPVWRGRRPERG
jgi:hypothetical protein